MPLPSLRLTTRAEHAELAHCLSKSRSIPPIYSSQLLQVELDVVGGAVSLIYPVCSSFAPGATRSHPASPALQCFGTPLAFSPLTDSSPFLSACRCTTLPPSSSDAAPLCCVRAVCRSFPCAHNNQLTARPHSAPLGPAHAPQTRFSPPPGVFSGSGPGLLGVGTWNWIVVTLGNQGNVTVYVRNARPDAAVTTYSSNLRDGNQIPAGSPVTGAFVGQGLDYYRGVTPYFAGAIANLQARFVVLKLRCGGPVLDVARERRW